MEYLEKNWEDQTDTARDTMLFLDIETTGLCKYKNYIFCIGVLYKEKNIFFQKQWFIKKKDEECTLLLAFLEVFQTFSCVCTYAGSLFDMPFLCERFSLYHLDTSLLLNKVHLDLKKIPCIKTFFKEKDFSRFKLEKSLQYKRTVTTSGKDRVKLYQLYTSKPLSQYKVLLLSYNAEELGSLYTIWQFATTLTHLHFLDKIATYVRDNIFFLTFKCQNASKYFFDISVQDLFISFDQNLLELSLGVPLYTASLKRYLPSYKDYYYIPSQEKIIHASVAKFIPNSMKQVATKEQCVIYKESVFLKLPKKFKSPEDDYPLYYNDEGICFIQQKDCNEKLLWQIIKKTLNPR